jgi:hypothetical protein
MKKITILLFAVTALAAGCKKFTENINNNPNQPTTVTPNVLLSAALTTSASDMANDFQSTARWMGYWARSGNFIQTIPQETYAITTGYADGEWQNLYGELAKYKYLENNSQGDPFYVGVAKTMEALDFSTLVDGFGNVPYSQAFNLQKYPNPKYDDAATIYAALVVQCDSAVTEFQKAITFYNTTATSTQISTDANYDIVYGRLGLTSSTARINYWIKFANSVKLRILMTARTSSASAFSSSNITAEIAKVTATGQGFIGSDYTQGTGYTYDASTNESAAVNPGYTNASASQQNPLFGDFYLPANTPNNDLAFFRASQYYINYGKNTNDARYSDDYSYFGNYVWAGIYDGDPNAASNANTSQLGANDGSSSPIPTTIGTLKSSSQSEFIMSDFESLYWQAEAAELGYLPTENPLTLSITGVEQSYVYVNDTGDGVTGDNVTDADQNFVAASGGTMVDMTGTTITMQAIMTLKWSAENTINWEQAYTDYRRTGYPVPDGTNFGFSHANNVVQHTNPTTGLKINFPYRYLYPQSEINTNGANIPSGTGPYTAIFWDNREK